MVAPGSMFSAGTRTSSSTSSEVTDARSESFLWISGALKPRVPFSTMKPRISPSSVRAQTTAMSAIVPFVIHIFVPLRIQSAPSRRACVRIVPGSEPASGSVRPKQPITSPRVHPRQPLLLLLLRAPAPDREHRERPLHRDDAADPGVAGLELRAGEPVGDGARAREAVALEVHPEEAELRELADHLARQHAALEPVADLGHDLLADELAHGVADRPLLVVEERVDARGSRAGRALTGCSVVGADTGTSGSRRDRRHCSRLRTPRAVRRAPPPTSVRPGARP